VGGLWRFSFGEAGHINTVKSLVSWLVLRAQILGAHHAMHIIFNNHFPLSLQYCTCIPLCCSTVQVSMMLHLWLSADRLQTRGGGYSLCYVSRLCAKYPDHTCYMHNKMTNHIVPYDDGPSSFAQACHSAAVPTNVCHWHPYMETYIQACFTCSREASKAHANHPLVSGAMKASNIKNKLHHK
jgi:hypothetical protein